jgi:hypothetical protein
MRLRIGALTKIQEQVDMSNGIKNFAGAPVRDLKQRNSREIGEVLEDIRKGSRHARITHWEKDLREEKSL